MKTISVIIPIFNNQDTLERAVLSVVNEPLVSEILVVDDGSTDSSSQIAKCLSAKFSIIRILQHPNLENRGAPSSRNLGLAQAKSNWIQFLDADDELVNGKLAGQMDLVNDEVSFVVGNSIHVLPDGRRHYRKSDNDIWKGLIRSKLGDTCANLWNRKFLMEIGGWDETLSSSQEYDLMFRLLCGQFKLVFDKRYLTLIHKTENSISTIPFKNDIRSKNWLELRERIRAYLIGKKMFDLRYKYLWSGSVGMFCQELKVELPPQLNEFLFWLYSLEIYFKKKLYHLVKNN